MMMYQSSPVATAQIAEGFADGVIRLLWVTDSHVIQQLDHARNLQLKRAVEACNEWKPTAFIHTGDIGNDWIERVQIAFNILKFCKRPVLAVIGNHDENELVDGEPNTLLVADSTAFNRNPLYTATTLNAPDGSWSLLVLMLDCNYYADDPDGDTPGDSPYHEPGDRIGNSASTPGGGYFRMFTDAQIAFVETTLAASNADAVLVLTHYPPHGVVPVDYPALIDKFQADGRPTIAFCGHNHPDATTYTKNSTDGLYTLTFYKCPALQESGCWTEVALSFDGSLVIESLNVKNFTNPGAWTINAPFTEV